MDAARTWIGTPYAHQGRTKGQGVDCIGFIWGVGQDLGYKRDIPNTYMRSPSGGQLKAGCDANLTKVDDKALNPGAVVIFYGIDVNEAQHFAILATTAGQLTMIHAFSKFRMVREQPFDRFWQPRVMGVYEYPDTEPWKVNDWA